MNIKNKFGIFIICVSMLGTPLMARETVYKNKRTPAPLPPARSNAGCDQATSQKDLDINNVRALLFNGGDMWWDRGGTGNSRYEIPKVEPGEKSVHSLFAGALWFGGVDDNNILKTAGQTYRQFANGTFGANDFWPGPLDTVNATIDADECLKWDKHFEVKREDIMAAQQGGPLSLSILSWPAHGDVSKNQAWSLAPFIDKDGDNFYEPGEGEHPYLDACPGKTVIPDQMIWWIYNDKGNVHTKYPGGEPIGLEVHAMAFAFKTANDINNMTFYKYKIFNRGSSPLRDTYFAQWVDADLGNAGDDYVGCDVDRSLGYVYNGDGDDEDGTGTGYGLIPPAVGIDFFRGPKDSAGNEIPLSKFMYFTNAAPDGQDDPEDATEMYRYLRGIWANGIPLTYGGTGYNPASTDYADYALPGTTDPNGRPEWSETAANNPAGDRRLVQSAGPFVLQPGAVNEVIVGVVWARATAGDQLASLALLKTASDKAQILFDNCFELANGPDPVTLRAIEQENKIILALENTEKAEGYNKDELDDADLKLYNYKFQGYRIYQVRKPGVDINDPTQAVEIFTVDRKDGVTRIINKYYDSATDNIQAEIMVEGSDNGIRHTFEVTKDVFSLSSDNRLVNYKTYYFTVIPYGYSETATFTKYLPSRSSNTVVSGIPHKPVINDDLVHSFETGVDSIIRIEGKGNGGVVLDLTDETRDDILKNNVAARAIYERGRGPVNIKVYDPRAVPNHNFVLKVKPDYSGWTLTDLNTMVVTESDTSLTDDEQVIYSDASQEHSYGFTIQLNNDINNPGEDPTGDPDNGFQEATMEFADPTHPWFQPLPYSPLSTSLASWLIGPSPIDPRDPNEVYKSVLGGTFAPYRSVNHTIDSLSPGFDAVARNASVLANLGSVDLVLTSDSTKWTECVVVESGHKTAQTIGNAKRLNLRLSPGPGGRALGKSVFPGYAINVESGERVNIFFAENSMDSANNGRDMLFNPTSVRTGGANGGKHYLYVHRTRYDSCKAIYEALGGLANPALPGTPAKRTVYNTTDWVSVPMLRAGEELLSNDVKVRLRVNKSYSNLLIDGSNSGAPSYAFNMADIVQSFSDDASLSNAEALKIINVVPNPYYSFSGYESSRNDFKVRFTNLPKVALVTIYNVNGTLIRKLKKDDINQTYIDWDLQNEDRIPVASGMYIIHIKVPGVGEKTLKWFAVMRPLDFENF